MIDIIRPCLLKGQLKSEWILLKSHYRIGMRTIKTGIAVALCMIFFHYTNRGTPALAALAAVFFFESRLENEL